jgi:hypothetical protein
MTSIDRDRLVDEARNIVRLSDYRRSDFDIRCEAIARMFLAQRAAERASSAARTGRARDARASASSASIGRAAPYA